MSVNVLQELNLTTSWYWVAPGGVCGSLSIPSSKNSMVASIVGNGQVVHQGSCESQGYTVPAGTSQQTLPVIGDIAVPLYKKALQLQELSTSYYWIDPTNGVCGDYNSSLPSFLDSMIPSKYHKGSCASKGYTVPAGTLHHKVPVLGNVAFPLFKKALQLQELSSKGTSWYYLLPDGECGSLSVTSTNNSILAIDKSEIYKWALGKTQVVHQGTCESQGYTVQAGTSHESIPNIGAVNIKYFNKPLQLQELSSKTSWYFVEQNGDCGDQSIDSTLDYMVPMLNTTGYAYHQGSCESLGYTVPSGTIHYKFPAIGTVAIHTHKKPLQLQELSSMTSWYWVAPGGVCGSLSIPSSKNSMVASIVGIKMKSEFPEQVPEIWSLGQGIYGFQQGSCESQGYTVPEGTLHQTLPNIGSVAVPQFMKNLIMI